MAFSTDLARLVADQLSRFGTLNRHQLAGQAANLDFWLAQVRNALAVIDGYGVRFVRMAGAQEQYATAHGTVEFALGADGYEAKRRVAPPRRIPDAELRRARRELTEAAARFLKRCRKDGLVTAEQFHEAIQGLGAE